MAPTPEPATWVLIAATAGAAALLKRRRARGTR
ncbi:MAG: PEP-CTERM sorting domain-containing protein [Armatimonadota bacterium]